MLILTSYLKARFGAEHPLRFAANIAFEQSYAGVDGDSASLGELCGLLSAIGKLPVRQSWGITGSVNQFGEVQPIGGVNEKIEGFFDICAGRGLSGSEGVLIPASSVQHLMLRRDVVEACEAGRFAVYPVRGIDEGIAILTGRVAGERGTDGLYPAGSINRAVEDRLRRFAELRREADGRENAGGEKR